MEKLFQKIETSKKSIRKSTEKAEFKKRKIKECQKLGIIKKAIRIRKRNKQSDKLKSIIAMFKALVKCWSYFICFVSNRVCI